MKQGRDASGPAVLRDGESTRMTAESGTMRTVR